MATAAISRRPRRREARPSRQAMARTKRKRLIGTRGRRRWLPREGHRVRRDRAIAEPQDAVREARELRVVGDEDEGRSQLAVQLAQEAHHVGPVGGVEVAGGLVGEEDPRAVDEGPGHRHPLLLPPGELRRVVVAAVAEPDALEELPGPRPPVLAPQLERHLDVLPGGESGDEVEGLEDEADLLRPAPAPARPRRASRGHGRRGRRGRGSGGRGRRGDRGACSCRFPRGRSRPGSLRARART